MCGRLISTINNEYCNYSHLKAWEFAVVIILYAVITKHVGVFSLKQIRQQLGTKQSKC